MTGEETPDGGYGRDALYAIRERIGHMSDAGLRAEELDLLRQWHAACEDPARRYELSRIIGLFGAAAGPAPTRAIKPRFPLSDA